MADMNHRRSDHSIINHENFIYAVGSFTEEKFKSHCERYNIEENSWEKIAPMTKPRSGVGLCTFNENYIFAFGGRDAANGSLNRIEVYDIAQNFWKEITYSNDVWPGAYLCGAQ